MKRNGTICNLTGLKQAYALPFLLAKKAVDKTTSAAENILQKKSVIFYWNGSGKIAGQDLLVDVSTKSKSETGKIVEFVGESQDF